MAAELSDLAQGGLQAIAGKLDSMLKPLLKDGFEEAEPKLKRWQAQIAKYAVAAYQGDRNAKAILESCQRQAALLVARYERQYTEASKAAAREILAVLGQLALAFLRGLVLP